MKLKPESFGRALRLAIRLFQRRRVAWTAEPSTGLGISIEPLGYAVAKVASALGVAMWDKPSYGTAITNATAKLGCAVPVIPPTKGSESRSWPQRVVPAKGVCIGPELAVIA